MTSLAQAIRQTSAFTRSVIGAVVFLIPVVIGAARVWETPTLVADTSARVDTLSARVDTLAAEQRRDRAYIYTELEWISCERKAENGMDGKTLGGCIDEYRRAQRGQR